MTDDRERQAFTVTIWAEGDHENTAAEAVHHALAAANRAGHNIEWSDINAMTPLYYSVQLDNGETSETSDEAVARRKFAIWSAAARNSGDKVSLCQVFITTLETSDEQ